jgi:hypothetical protein
VLADGASQKFYNAGFVVADDGKYQIVVHVFNLIFLKCCS